MDLNSQPDTVWMCFREEERLVEKSQQIFHRLLSDEEYAKLVGARTGEMILIISGDYQQPIGSFIPLIFIRHHRTVLVNGHSASVLVVTELPQPMEGFSLIFRNARYPRSPKGKVWLPGCSESRL